jgi:hypothetical protein
MRKRFIALAVSALPVLAACATIRAADAPPLPVIEGDRFKGIIVPASNVIAGSWTPTDEQVFIAEPKLQECVVDAHRVSRIDLPRHFRQYSGETMGERRMLSVQFFDLRFHKLDTVRRPVIVVDGTGDTHFTAEYDFDAERCVRVY